MLANRRMWTNTHHPQVEIRRDQYGVHHLVLPVLVAGLGCC
jgi:hypothetical protein